MSLLLSARWQCRPHLAKDALRRLRLPIQQRYVVYSTTQRPSAPDLYSPPAFPAGYRPPLNRLNETTYVPPAFAPGERPPLPALPSSDAAPPPATIKRSARRYLPPWLSGVLRNWLGIVCGVVVGHLFYSDVFALRLGNDTIAHFTQQNITQPLFAAINERSVFADPLYPIATEFELNNKLTYDHLHHEQDNTNESTNQYPTKRPLRLKVTCATIFTVWFGLSLLIRRRRMQWRNSFNGRFTVGFFIMSLVALDAAWTHDYRRFVVDECLHWPPQKSTAAVGLIEAASQRLGPTELRYELQHNLITLMCLPITHLTYINIIVLLQILTFSYRDMDDAVQDVTGNLQRRAESVYHLLTQPTSALTVISSLLTSLSDGVAAELKYYSYCGNVLFYAAIRYLSDTLPLPHDVHVDDAKEISRISYDFLVRRTAQLGEDRCNAILKSILSQTQLNAALSSAMTTNKQSSSSPSTSNLSSSTLIDITLDQNVMSVKNEHGMCTMESYACKHYHRRANETLFNWFCHIMGIIIEYKVIDDNNNHHHHNNNNIEDNNDELTNAHIDRALSIEMDCTGPGTDLYMYFPIRSESIGKSGLLCIQGTVRQSSTDDSRTDDIDSIRKFIKQIRFHQSSKRGRENRKLSQIIFTPTPTQIAKHEQKQHDIMTQTDNNQSSSVAVNNTSTPFNTDIWSLPYASLAVDSDVLAPVHYDEDIGAISVGNVNPDREYIPYDQVLLSPMPAYATQFASRHAVMTNYIDIGLESDQAAADSIRRLFDQYNVVGGLGHSMTVERISFVPLSPHDYPRINKTPQPKSIEMGVTRLPMLWTQPKNAAIIYDSNQSSNTSHMLQQITIELTPLNNNDRLHSVPNELTSKSN